MTCRLRWSPSHPAIVEMMSLGSVVDEPAIRINLLRLDGIVGCFPHLHPEGPIGADAVQSEAEIIGAAVLPVRSWSRNQTLPESADDHRATQLHHVRGRHPRHFRAWSLIGLQRKHMQSSGLRLCREYGVVVSKATAQDFSVLRHRHISLLRIEWFPARHCIE